MLVYVSACQSIAARVFRTSRWWGGMVLGKQIDMEMLLLDDTLAEAFVNGKLTRQSAFLCMTAVFEQLCESTCTDVRDWRIAACRNLRSVQAGECRLRRSTGEYVLFNARTKQALLEVPQLLLKACIRICTQGAGSERPLEGAFLSKAWCRCDWQF